MSVDIGTNLFFVYSKHEKLLEAIMGNFIGIAKAELSNLQTMEQLELIQTTIRIFQDGKRSLSKTDKVKLEIIQGMLRDFLQGN